MVQLVRNNIILQFSKRRSQVNSVKGINDKFPDLIKFKTF